MTESCLHSPYTNVIFPANLFPFNVSGAVKRTVIEMALAAEYLIEGDCQKMYHLR
jgi:hypothetical protein